MDAFEDWLFVAYIGILVFVLVSLLCGNWPIFNRTPIRALHLWFGGGACDFILNVVRKCCGQKGVGAYEFVEHACCERPNPILQVFYLLLITGIFVTFYRTSFKFIPGPYISSYHRCTGSLAVIFGFFLFLVTSFCDPGTINASNVSRHENVYPFDGILYAEKTCPTCEIPRPARSKHCSICNRCVARFDHHCGWMNNCIGEKNLRYFLLFLIWHSSLCCYGVYVLATILIGEVTRHNIMQRISYYYGDITLYESFPHILQWFLAFYHVQVLLLLFLVIVFILLTVFLCYHLYLTAKNITTNEVYKWESYEMFSDEYESRVVQQRQFCCGFLNSKKRQKQTRRKDIYNRGVWANICEVLCPAAAANSNGSKVE